MAKKDKNDTALNIAMMLLSLVIHGAVSSFFAIVNTLGFLFEKVQQSLHQKVDIDCTKQVVVITGCDSGFGELSSIRLSSMGFKVISGCISQEGADRLKDTVSR